MGPGLFSPFRGPPATDIAAFLNRRTVGGLGDTHRTVAVAELLVRNRDDRVV